jgi:hypothetical protein
MSGGRRKPLTAEDIGALLVRLKDALTRPECRSCECLQGFLSQMELDAAPDAKPLLTKQRVPPKKICACLGCEPCPPAAIFAEYLLRRH